MSLRIVRMRERERERERESTEEGKANAHIVYTRERERESYDNFFFLPADFDYLAARADHPLGMFTSGCGHHMHAECWRR